MKNSTYNPIGFLSGSTIKIIACILMAIDHIGYHLFPDLLILRIIGRLSMPLFAFFIAEGCHYTKNKLKHFLLIAISGLIFLIGVKLFADFWYLNIFLIFAISVLYIYLMQHLKNISLRGNYKIIKSILAILFFTIATIIGYLIYEELPFEYGFYVMMLPVFISIVDLKKYIKHPCIKYIDNFYTRLIIMTIAMIPTCIDRAIHEIQFYSYFALIILLFYNGKGGSKKLKYFFYLFYPVHIMLIYAIKFLFF